MPLAYPKGDKRSEAYGVDNSGAVRYSLQNFMAFRGRRKPSRSRGEAPNFRRMGRPSRARVARKALPGVPWEGTPVEIPAGSMKQEGVRGRKFHGFRNGRPEHRHVPVISQRVIQVGWGSGLRAGQAGGRAGFGAGPDSDGGWTKTEGMLFFDFFAAGPWGRPGLGGPVLLVTLSRVRAF